MRFNNHIVNNGCHGLYVGWNDFGCKYVMILGKQFNADLLSLNFHEFDIILGMDWLNKYQAVVDCGAKTVVLKSVDGTETVVHGIRSSTLPTVISVMQARKLMRKGCEAYLAVVLDS